jgi:hypothetical protein
VLIAALIVLLIGVVLILVFRPVDASRPPRPPVVREEPDPIPPPAAPPRSRAPAYPSEDSAARRERITRETLAARSRFRRRLHRGRRRRAWLLAVFAVFLLALLVVLAVVASGARAV